MRPSAAGVERAVRACFSEQQLFHWASWGLQPTITSVVSSTSWDTGKFPNLSETVPPKDVLRIKWEQNKQ